MKVHRGAWPRNWRYIFVAAILPYFCLNFIHLSHSRSSLTKKTRPNFRNIPHIFSYLESVSAATRMASRLHYVYPDRDCGFGPQMSGHPGKTGHVEHTL
jgi:hypothetical protein